MSKWAFIIWDYEEEHGSGHSPLKPVEMSDLNGEPCYKYLDEEDCYDFVYDLIVLELDKDYET